MIPAITIKINTWLKYGFLMLLLCWLMTGLAIDNEFYEDYRFFVKHRPSLQYYFRSPLGMQDMPPDYPAVLRKEQAAYEAFVLTRHWSSRLPWLAELWIAGTALILTIGIVKQARRSRRSHGK